MPHPQANQVQENLIHYHLVVDGNPTENPLRVSDYRTDDYTYTERVVGSLNSSFWS